MSRLTLHNGKRFTIVIGIDHILKSFVQLYDKLEENKTPEGEGLILDWSVAFGAEVNKNNIDLTQGTVLENIKEYIKRKSPVESKYVDFII